MLKNGINILLLYVFLICLIGCVKFLFLVMFEIDN